MIILANAISALKKLLGAQLLNGSIRVRTLDLSPGNLISRTFLQK
jgi:hypothetical protein